MLLCKTLRLLISSNSEIEIGKTIVFTQENAKSEGKKSWLTAQQQAVLKVHRESGVNEAADRRKAAARLFKEFGLSPVGLGGMQVVSG